MEVGRVTGPIPRPCFRSTVASGFVPSRNILPWPRPEFFAPPIPIPFAGRLVEEPKRLQPGYLKAPVSRRSPGSLHFSWRRHQVGTQGSWRDQPRPDPRRRPAPSGEINPCDPQSPVPIGLSLKPGQPRSSWLSKREVWAGPDGTPGFAPPGGPGEAKINLTPYLRGD